MSGEPLIPTSSDPLSHSGHNQLLDSWAGELQSDLCGDETVILTHSERVDIRKAKSPCTQPGEQEQPEELDHDSSQLNINQPSYHEEDAFEDDNVV